MEQGKVLVPPRKCATERRCETKQSRGGECEPLELGLYDCGESRRVSRERHAIKREDGMAFYAWLMIFIIISSIKIKNKKIKN